MNYIQDGDIGLSYSIHRSSQKKELALNVSVFSSFSIYNQKRRWGSSLFVSLLLNLHFPIERH